MSGGFFGIGPSEFMVLGLLAIIVLGPEKLPRYVADAARFIKDMRAMVNKARREVTEQLGPEFDHLKDISLKDLNPREFVKRNLFDGDDDPLGLRDDPPTPRPAPQRLPAGDPVPYDTDAT